jgi:hypothetical protein
VDEGGGRERRVRSARALVDLALDFADRAHAAEAALVEQFGTAAAALAAELGPVVVESDDDEQVLLRADGVLAGEVLDENTGAWLAVESPEEVARYYDSTDLFLDLADALIERFPELAPEFPDVGGRSGSGAPDEAVADAHARAYPGEVAGLSRPEVEDKPPSTDPEEGLGLGWGGDAADDPGASAPAGRPAIAATLESLRRSGVLSDADFERLKAQLEG